MTYQLIFHLFTCLVLRFKANAILFPQENLELFNCPLSIQQAMLPTANADLNIYALPVGQGDCTVIQCPTQFGGEITIVDIGSKKSKTGFTSDKLMHYLYGQRIEYLFLTHQDKDHINYVQELFSKLSEQNIPYPIVYHSCPWDRYGIEVPNLDHREIKHCCPCGSINICQGNVDLKVVASALNNCPPAPISPNGDSIVLKVNYQGTNVFLPGDFEGNEDLINYFLANAGNIQSKVMRLSHHGADNNKANTKAFLEAVNPIHAFSSSGLNTVYGHFRCSLYDTLIEDFQIESVPSHYYTCYSVSIKPKAFKTIQTQKAIYTTTIGDPKAKPPWYINYVIHYGINSVTGDISVDVTQV